MVTLKFLPCSDGGDIELFVMGMFANGANGSV